MATNEAENEQLEQDVPATKKRKTSSKKEQDKISFVLEQEISPEDVIHSQELASNSELHSSMKAQLLFEWLLYPTPVEAFYENYWEKRPVVIKHKFPKYYDGWFNKAELDRILSEHTLDYGKDIELVKYTEETQHNITPDGTATGKQVWRHFKEGATIVLLCPQKFSDQVWKLLSILEEKWNSMTTSRVQLTPKNAQAFAPRYHEYDSFVLQIEGSKSWKIYPPLDEASTLPRYPSGNLKQDEITKPVLEVTLEEGDLLYFPRGFISQANTSKDHESLDLTLTTGQNNTMGHFLELLLPQAIGAAFTNSLSLRKALPENYLSYMGVMHSDLEDHPERQAFEESVKKALRAVMGEAMDMIDAGADQMAKNYLIDRLPPALEEEEEDCTVENSPLLKITVNTQMKLLRYGMVRLVVEDGKAVIYHSKDNSRVHHENPISPLEFELDDAESIEFILQSYPEYFRVGDLPHEDPDDQIGLVKALYDEGILMYEKKSE